jgi:hypothetical protein
MQGVWNGKGADAPRCTCTDFSLRTIMNVAWWLKRVLVFRGLAEPAVELRVLGKLNISRAKIYESGAFWRRLLSRTTPQESDRQLADAYSIGAGAVSRWANSEGVDGTQITPKLSFSVSGCVERILVTNPRQSAK